MSNNNKMLEHALALWEKGFRVFPLGSPDERPPSYLVQRLINKTPGKIVTPEQAQEIAVKVWPKRPRFGWKALQGREVTREEVEDWWTKTPLANIGIVCGPVIVIDADSQESCDWIENESGITFTPYRVSTSQGKHYYYRAPHGSDIRNSVDVNAKLDVRGVGGYVVGAGSIHNTRSVYTETIMPGFEMDTITDLPFITQNDLNLVAGFNGHEVLDMPLDGLVDMRGVSVPADNRPAQEGERNTHATSLAGQYIKAGVSLEQTMQHLVAWNNNNERPLDDSEVATVVASVAQTHHRNTGEPVRVSDPDPVPVEPAEPVADPDPVVSGPAVAPVQNPAPESPDPDQVAPPVPTPPAPPAPPKQADPGAPLPPPAMGILPGLSAPPASTAFHEKFFTLGELASKPIVPLDDYWMKSLIFRRSRILIAGEPKIGKSRFALHLAIQAACGGEWLGSAFNRAYRVIWIQAEIREWHLRERTQMGIKDLSRREQDLVHENLMVSDRFDCNLLDPLEFSMIGSIFERHKPDLVIFDPLINFITADENNAQEMNKALRQLNALEAQFDCAIGLIHHTRKLDKKWGKGKEKAPATFDDVRGSSAITGWPDMGIVLSGTDTVTQCSWMARACKPPSTGNIGWNASTGRYDVEFQSVMPIDAQHAEKKEDDFNGMITYMRTILAQNVGDWMLQKTLVEQADQFNSGLTDSTVLNLCIKALLKAPNVHTTVVDGLVHVRMIIDAG